MKKNLLILAFFMGLSASINAQEDNYNINGFSIGITPTALLNIYMGYQIEVGYGFLDYFELEVNTGYLVGSLRDKVYEGYRIRTTLKYYFKNDFEEHRQYLGIGYLHRNIDENLFANFQMFGGAFYQEKEIDRNKSLHGGYLIYGVKYPINYSNFYYDVGVALGVGQITVKNEFEPGGIQEPEENFFESYRTDGESPYIIIFAHFSVGYNF